MNYPIEELSALVNTSGSIAKQHILQMYRGNELFVDTLRFIYNPYHKTHISKAKMLKIFSMPRTRTGVDLRELLDYFSTERTGTDADMQVAANFIWYLRDMAHTEAPDNVAYVKMLLSYAEGIITQELKTGINATTLRKVYGTSFIPHVGCMLGTQVTKMRPANIKWPCIVTEKLDGVRRILIKKNGVCKMYSRSGHLCEGHLDILKDAEHLPDNMVYDGELIANIEAADSIQLRQMTASLANSGGIKNGLLFMVFDMIPEDEFTAGSSKQDALNRKMRLGATLNDHSIEYIVPEGYTADYLIAGYGIEQKLEWIRPVPILGLVRSMSEVTDIVGDIWKRKGEGVMLNTSSGLYVLKRSKDLLKVKKVQDITLRIIGMTEGSGKYEGMLGSLVVNYKGNKLGVGSGFNDYQRRHIWEHRDTYIGMQVEIETFGESTNALGDVSLNCPIFKRFRDEVD